jgi:CspA family cold shock protein
MPTGKIKSWNAERGFGFIGNDDGGPDVFVHVTAFEEAGLNEPTAGDRGALLNCARQEDRQTARDRHSARVSAIRLAAVAAVLLFGKMMIAPLGKAKRRACEGRRLS